MRRIAGGAWRAEAIVHSIELSGLIIAPLVQRIAGWLDTGKLDEAELDGALTPNARSIVDPSTDFTDWVPLADVETLVAVVAGQLGGETGLADWAQTVVDGWADEQRVVSIRQAARGLVDGPGYVVIQSSKQLIRDSDWHYEGGRNRFSVRLGGLETASSDLRALLGALLSRLAEATENGFEDVRFEAVAATDLLVFGKRNAMDPIDEKSEIRLHRAALA
jgi:hypothetical protein